MSDLEDDLSGAYLEWCQAHREPANTLRARARVLRSISNAGVASREEVEAWWEARSGLAPATRVADLAGLRSFYKWCQVWEHRADDPTVRLKSPRLPNRVPRPARRNDVRRLILELDRPLSRATVLGAYLGLRVSESAGLDWLEVDEDQGIVRVTGKGGKTRLVPISPAILALLGDNRVGNIVRAGLEPLSAAQLRQALNRAMKLAGVNATSHQLRHLYGTTAYEASGGDVLAVRDLMGHQSTQTTAGYAQPSMEVARKIANAMTQD